MLTEQEVIEIASHHIKTLDGNIGELIAPKEAMVKRIMEYISDTFLKSITKQEMRDTIFY
ncbi:hypothetical protein FY557_10990 [Chryseobacterium sp. SN22]|uniref:hypothetical protein n=1 Tax=Chryseobacterium sp. SN22 TaxID=2606431 RepID=UPI0011EE6D74|nr:hypothetical protein [Chryseobacterium sp. SN22]KAA0127924.1 hypothetical protein FY557_10990 [Chryseobacterium sp. SN22]